MKTMVSSDVGGHPSWNPRAMEARDNRREGSDQPITARSARVCVCLTIDRQVGIVVTTYRIREQ